MMAAKVRTYISFALYSIICVFICLLQSGGIAPLNIKTASAVLSLPFVVYAGIYFGAYSGAVFGLVAGAVSDVYSSTVCFNTVVLTVLGFVCGFLITYLFNRNAAAAIVLNIGAGTVYFFMKWLIGYAFRDAACGFVLVRFTIPSFLYTAAIGVLLFFILNPLLKKLVPRSGKF